MIDFATHRKHPDAKLTDIREEREKRERANSHDDSCEHEWKRYSQRIQPERDIHVPEHISSPGRARTLSSWRTPSVGGKRLIDLVVER